MGKVYTNQTYLRIELTAEVSVNGAKETKIYFRRPSGSVGSVNATVIDAQAGVLRYELDATETSFVDEAGIWQFWVFVTFGDDRVARGEPLRVRIYEN